MHRSFSIPVAGFCAWLWTVAPLAAADPRIALIDLQLEGDDEAALAEVKRLLAADPAARALGLDYLEARLLERLGRRESRATSLLNTISAVPSLALHGYYHLALEHERQGHPEMAAGLVARVVAAGGSFSGLEGAVRLLRRSLGRGGDCRLLGGVDESRLPLRPRRLLSLVRAECALRESEADRARALATRLLRENRSDEAAYQAALFAADRLVRREDLELAAAVGLALHEHREFARSNVFLDQVLLAAPPGSFVQRYARARNDFWLGLYLPAATAFTALIDRAPDANRKADVLYQLARCRELANDWTAASAAYRRSHMADPGGEWSGASLLAALRLEWLGGSEPSALALLDLLRRQRPGEDYLARALLFLAASELVQQKAERAGGWLAEAERTGQASVAEVSYWQGRLAEAKAQLQAAVAAYLRVLLADPYDPFAREARERLARPELVPLAQALGSQLAASAAVGDLRAAVLLLGEGHPRSQAALIQIAKLLTREPGASAFLRLAIVPAAQWSLWRAPAQSAEERLLALGVFAEGAPALERHFPTGQPSLSFTAGRLLARDGDTRRALLVAEILAERVPPALPFRLLPSELKELLYPLPYAETFRGRAREQAIDPALVAAIAREESRFDPEALSSASARGLMQVTQTLVRRIGPRMGRPDLRADELYQPEVAITVGSAYLGELSRLFGGAEHAMAAAYNAGEEQTRVWLGYCRSKEPAEFYSKVGFRQTRNYVRKVLTSRAHYREIYPGLAPAPAR
ncbi:MAG TPA: lytic transglycosylase domain-containing protein [Thermoanaerobaculia bacterium]|nr:lytic transglycosylase domain-containing protein [Thermoanaerobaculia bacterium]